MYEINKDTVKIEQVYFLYELYLSYIYFIKIRYYSILAGTNLARF